MCNLVESDEHGETLAMLRRKCAAHSRTLNRQRQAFKNTIETGKR